MLALLTAEQDLLRNMVHDLAASAAVASPLDIETVDRAKAWDVLSRAGLLGLRRRGDDGEPEASGVEIALTAEALGSVLAPLPYLGTAVMAVELLAQAGASDLVADIADGRARYGIALTPDLSTTAGSGAGPAIAFDTDRADYLLGLAGPGTTVVRWPASCLSTRDGADLTRSLSALDAGPAEAVGAPIAPEGWARWLALALTALSADIAGTARGALDRVIAYSQDRVQFGVPIGSFQAVQHLCAEAFVKVEAAWSLTKYAAWAVDAMPPADALLAARVAKAHASTIGREVGETVMQVYGGIGQTWEHVAHLHLRRALLDSALLGDAARQLDAIADTRFGAR